MDSNQRSPDPGSTRHSGSREAKRERLRTVRKLVSTEMVANQHDLVDLLAARGYEVTQATVSRDIAELGLVKTLRSGQPAYAFPSDLAQLPPAHSDARLRRVVADYPIAVGRSGLTLLLVSDAGTADAIGQAIDESTLTEQEGTLAGDNTILVLFADEARLDTWLERFSAMLPGQGDGETAQ